MPRNMSFWMTLQQMKDGVKDVTRRCGWWFLKPGDILNAVEKGQGLKKGEKVTHLYQIKVVSTRKERLCDITQEECVREGFPDYTPEDFILMFCLHNKDAERYMRVNRIEFKRLPDRRIMNDQQIKELKKAILKMEQVVLTMPYHRTIKTAWKDLKKAVAPAIIIDQPKQELLFKQ